MVALGPPRRLRMVALGARSRLRAVVLGPRLLVSLASCCRPRRRRSRVLVLGVRCPSCSSFVRWSFVAVSLVVFGCGCPRLRVVGGAGAPSPFVGGCWGAVVAVYGCWWAWWAVVVLGGGRGVLLALVGCCGGSSTLVVSLCWCVGLVGCPGRLWLLVGMVGGCRMWLSVGGLEWVGWDGGAHQWTTTNDELSSFVVWVPRRRRRRGTG